MPKKPLLILSSTLYALYLTNPFLYVWTPLFDLWFVQFDHRTRTSGGETGKGFYSHYCSTRLLNVAQMIHSYDGKLTSDRANSSIEVPYFSHQCHQIYTLSNEEIDEMKE